MNILNKILNFLTEAFSKDATDVDNSAQHDDTGVNAGLEKMKVVALLDAEVDSARFKYILYTNVNGERGYKLIGSSGVYTHTASSTYTDCVGLWLHNIDAPEVLAFIAEKSTWPKNDTDPVGPGQILRPSKPIDDEPRSFKPQTSTLAEVESMFRSSISTAIEETANPKDREALELLILKLYGKTHIEVFNSYFINPNEFSAASKENAVSKALKDARVLLRSLPGSPELPSWAAWKVQARREAFYREYAKKFNVTISD